MAVEILNRYHADLFSCLQLWVYDLQRWTIDDVRNNLEGGTFVSHGHEDRPPAIAEIEALMERPRTYIEPAGIGKRDLESARCFSEHFDNIFVRSRPPSLPTVTTSMEFVAFFNVLRCFHEDSNLIKANSSYALKAQNFTMYFLSPPFFYNPTEYFKFNMKVPWEFPMFVNTSLMPSSWHKFLPQSHSILSSSSFLFPFLMSEVPSDESDSGRSRILLQAIAVARAGQYLMKVGAPMQFFVVGIYLHADLTVERFIVVQTGPGRQVSIVQKKFDLTVAGEAVAFLRDMFNLAGMIEHLAGYLDPDKKNSLHDLELAASEMKSVTSQAQATRSTSPSIPEDSECDEDEDKDEDDLGVFAADDIQAILKNMKYKIVFIPFGHPLLAVVSSVNDDSEKGFLKFVQEEQEIEILRYLTGIDSPSNHTIAVLRIWPVHGGTVVWMPAAGGWLTSLKDPNAHLWSVAKQLFEAVDFMHRHGVAHLDLKPQNIMIPVNGGRLSIIDFNRSQRVKGIDDMFSGIVGTQGYIPPEVAADNGLYSAIRADLWSCGKALHELCKLCRQSKDSDALLEIAQQLMSDDPEKRPTMSEVLERLA